MNPHDNPDRLLILEILQNLTHDDTWKVVMSTTQDRIIKLSVEKLTKPFRFINLWQQWESVREVYFPDYQSILRYFEKNPEFLEFEVSSTSLKEDRKAAFKSQPYDPSRVTT